MTNCTNIPMGSFVIIRDPDDYETFYVGQVGGGVHTSGPMEGNRKPIVMANKGYYDVEDIVAIVKTVEDGGLL